MPTYQYECETCDHSFEILQSMLDEKLKKCPQCGEDQLYRLIGAGSGIIFKGSGFYETDYKKKETPKSSSEGSSKAASVNSTEQKTDKCASCPGKAKVDQTA